MVGTANPESVPAFAAIRPPLVGRPVGAAPLPMPVLGPEWSATALVADSVPGPAAGRTRSWLVRSRPRTARVGRAGTGARIGPSLGPRPAARRG